MIVDCIADLHGVLPDLEGEGDLLIVAGDVLGEDSEIGYLRFYEWLVQQRYRKILFIAGNHDHWIMHNIKPFHKGKVEYLCDSGTVFEDYKIWGCPWSRRFCDDEGCNAFTGTEAVLDLAFSIVPDDVDILITHTPAKDTLDGGWGSSALLGHLTYRFRPYLHVFGHTHEGYGMEETLACRDDKRMISVNASLMNQEFEPVNKPIRVIL